MHAPETALRIFEHAADIIVGTEVGPQETYIAILENRIVQIHRKDRIPVRGEHAGRHPSYTAGGAGHHRHFPVIIFHIACT